MQKTLLQVAREIVTESDVRSPRYELLNNYQRNKLIDSATQYSSVKTVNSIIISEIKDALDEAVLNLAVMRQFYDESLIDSANFIAEDNAQRARDMNQVAKGGF